MRLVVIAVGERMPEWVDRAVDDYARRMPRALDIEVKAIRPARRSAGDAVARLLQHEAARIEAAIPKAALIVALDERGRALTSMSLAKQLDQWMQSGQDVAFLIGGPDGLDSSLKQRAQSVLQLSSFTLPHGLARVILVEQLYRAAMIRANHPYHRE